ncbi:MAG: TonB-dependent receptor [Brevundimonas sp.]|uniref:TonB-dependent receptor n=1 Tax=Brevundimonas albigilva TaxID=1312364 RepID=A0ABY4SLQ5_9CAUL|nr:MULTISPECIES: TonB-dependent receptor [Brevundimonas]PZU62162.1 MAG: TonB-dependent receptor [Brevundimonas sp.]UQV17640.1 TonB-dependent receptor [Brevundimonas albigilva]URI14497.1 TonB-dependent receptor [Brevundimonas albigilva]
MSLIRSSYVSKSALGVGVAALALVASGAVQAQTAAETQAQIDTQTVDDIVVTASPIVGSQRAALNQQRNADNLINVIAADTVGQFPDQNSAAALARLPAVAVQRDQGQERYLQVRGGPNRWTSVSVDGVNIIGVDEGGVSRAFRFDAVPAVILSALEVNKSLTPDLPGEAILARVNLRTFSPFERRGFHAQGDLGYGEMDLGGGPQEQAALRGSWSNDRFGVMAAASHYEREQITDNREFSYDADTGLPEAFDIRSYRVTRSSEAAMLGLAFRPADGHELFFKTLYSNFNDDEERNQYVLELADAVSGTIGADAGDLVGVPVTGAFNYGEYRNDNWISTLGGDHRMADWDLSWRINYTETENTTWLPMMRQMWVNPLTSPSLSYDRSDPNLPIVTLYDTVAGAGGLARGPARDSLRQGDPTLNLMIPITSAVNTESWVYKIDATRTFDWGGRSVEMSAGVEYDSREVRGSAISQTSVLMLPALLPRVGLTFNAADYVTDRPWDTGFPLGFRINWVDNVAMRRDIDGILTALEGAGLYDPANLTAPNGLYTIGEDLFAGYAMAKFQAGPAQIVAGLRVEHLSQDIGGFVPDSPTTFLPVNASQDDTSLFPSINVKFDLTDDILLRLSAQTGIARPSFSVVRTSASIDDTGETVSAGNPYLEPERTWGGDASLEWYLPGAGLASVSGFYRNVDNVLFDSQTVVEDDLFDAPGLDRTGYDYVTTLNGGEGKLYGVEIAYLQQFVFLPGVWSGFGFQGNLSLLSGDFEAPDGRTVDFPGVSDTIANASIFYENHGLSARVSYQWRSEWIDTLSFAGFGDQMRDGYENLDLSVRYAVTDNVSVYFDANNLSDETYVAYQGDALHPTEVEQVGRRYLAGLRFRF